MSKLPGILGGMPAFEHPLNIVNPAFPKLEQIAAPLTEALETGNVTNNSRYVRELEEHMREYLDGPDFVAVANGTVSLQLTLERCGLKGEVICPSFSYVATAHAIVNAGCKPVFADVDADTWNMTAESASAVLNDRTVAIMPVHVFGNPCDVESLERLSCTSGVKLIFDSAHAIGASYRNRKIGGFGDAESFSFHATKTLPMAEGGGISTNDAQLAADLRAARVFGDYGDHDCAFASANAKMQEFSAILGIDGLRRLDDNISCRRKCVERYRERLGEIAGIRFQRLNADAATSYQNFAVMVDPLSAGISRDELCEALNAENITSRKYFFPAIHKQKAYRETNADLPNTDIIADQVLCLPLHNHMAVELVEAICDAVATIFEHADHVRARLRT